MVCLRLAWILIGQEPAQPRAEYLDLHFSAEPGSQILDPEPEWALGGGAEGSSLTSHGPSLNGSPSISPSRRRGMPGKSPIFPPSWGNGSSKPKINVKYNIKTIIFLACLRRRLAGQSWVVLTNLLPEKIYSVLILEEGTSLRVATVLRVAVSATPAVWVELPSVRSLKPLLIHGEGDRATPIPPGSAPEGTHDRS